MTRVSYPDKDLYDDFRRQNLYVLVVFLGQVHLPPQI